MKDREIGLGMVKKGRREKQTGKWIKTTVGIQRQEGIKMEERTKVKERKEGTDEND